LTNLNESINNRWCTHHPLFLDISHNNVQYLCHSSPMTSQKIQLTKKNITLYDLNEKKYKVTTHSKVMHWVLRLEKSSVTRTANTPNVQLKKGQRNSFLLRIWFLSINVQRKLTVTINEKKSSLDLCAQTENRIYVGLTKNLEELDDELSVHYI